MFNCAAGREEHCKQISLACVGSAHSVWATLGLLPLTACVLSQSTLLRLQVALQVYCLKWALGCVHFPDLCRSGSGSWVLHKGIDSVGPAFCALPVKRAGSQEDLVSNSEHAHSLVEDAISGDKIVPCLLALAVAACPSASGREMGSPHPASSPLVFT